MYLRRRLVAHFSLEQSTAGVQDRPLLVLDINRMECPPANAEEDHRRSEVDHIHSNLVYWSANVATRMSYIQVLE